MALRNRQMGGVPLSKSQSFVIALLMTVFVPILGYTVWYPLLHIPEELRPFFAIAGALTHLGISSGVVAAGTERAQLWFGSYTGVSFPAGIYLTPRLPFPLILLVARIVFSKEVYNKILWAMEGDVPVESILKQFFAEGLTNDGVVIKITVTIVLEIVNVATYLSQTLNGSNKQNPVDIAVAEYCESIKSEIIAKHSVQDLMRGGYSSGSQTFNNWMTQTWKLVENVGLELAQSPIAQVEIVDEQVRLAFNRAQGKGVFAASAEAMAEAFRQFREKNPYLTEETAWLMFASSQGLDPKVSVDVVRFR